MPRLRGQGGLAWKFVLPVVHFVFRVTGRNWNTFYTWLINRMERRNSLDGIFEKYPANTGKDRGL